jgi:hypothetical protein
MFVYALLQEVTSFSLFRHDIPQGLKPMSLYDHYLLQEVTPFRLVYFLSECPHSVQPLLGISFFNS